MANTAHIYFNPDEAQVLAMGLASVIQDMNSHTDQPWTPEARKIRKDILSAAKSAAKKLEKFAGVKCNLPPYNPGDEQEFLTKES
jgi:hypothetical protein